jgi:phosphomannomutase / phosphoglucomutase
MVALKLLPSLGTGMKLNIFREYDIRGIVDDELVLNESYDLARAVITHMTRKYPTHKTYIVGRDVRSHSPALANHIKQALLDSGLDVIDIGICPTPAMYFAVYTLKLPTGIMVTASHNPKEYNGIKMWGVAGKEIQTTIKEIFVNRDFIPHAQTPGTLKTYDIITPYLDYLTQHFSHLKNSPITAIFDCGNGAACVVMPELVKRMGWENATLLFADADGAFPNHEPDPTDAKHMHALAEALAANQHAQVGLGFDGDCDRMNPMTKEGVLVPGDHMLGLYANNILKDMPGAAIVCDIKSSGSLIDMLKLAGGRACISPSGHSNIKRMMADSHAVLGGELSCHFFFNDRYFGYDDGIYAALRTLELIHESGKSLTDLLQVVPVKMSSPEIRIPCGSEANKAIIVEHVKKIFALRTDLELITIDGIRANMSYGWGLVRASNTQPVISLRFESDTAEGLAQVKSDFYITLAPYFDEQFLRKHIEI